MFRFGGTWFPLVASGLVIVASAARLVARRPWRRVLLEALFGVYAAFAFDMALLPVRFDAEWRAYGAENLPYIWRSVNLVPLRTIIVQLSPGAPPTAFSQILGNMALLLPFGVLAPVVFHTLRRPRAFLTAAFSAAVGIEALQLLERLTLIGQRSIDVDDVLLNTLGALIGYGIWAAASHVRSRLAADRPAAA